MKYQHFFITASLMIFTLPACRENTRPPDSEPAQPATADIIYTVTGGADMVSLFDITVSLTGETGDRDSAVITSLPFEKKLSKVQTPFTAMMTVTYTPKSHIPEKDSYEVGFGGGISYAASDGRQKNVSSISMLTVTKDEIQRYMAKGKGEKEYSESIN